MQDSLRALIKNVEQSAELVASSAEELSASAQQTSDATEQVATSIQEVAHGAEMQTDGVNDGESIAGCDFCRCHRKLLKTLSRRLSFLIVQRKKPK